MELTFYNSEIYATYMSSSDTRISLEPENKVVVSIDTDADEAALEHVRQRKLDGQWLPAVTREVRKAILYACEKSIDTMNEARAEVGDSIVEKGSYILREESSFLGRVQAALEAARANAREEAEADAALRALPEEVRGGEERSDEPTTQFRAALAC